MRRVYGARYDAWRDALLRIDPTRKLGSRYLDRVARLPGRRPDDGRRRSRGWWRFAVLWAPQTLALTGRGLTTFALGVWVYERTHSATLFALLEVSAILPGIVAAPVIGWAVDRLGARRAMIIADASAVLSCSRSRRRSTGTTRRRRRCCMRS